MQLTPPAGVETEPCEGRDLVSFSTVCPASRMMLGGTECSGSICFPYEEMDIMLTSGLQLNGALVYCIYMYDDQILLGWQVWVSS